MKAQELWRRIDETVRKCTVELQNLSPRTFWWLPCVAEKVLQILPQKKEIARIEVADVVPDDTGPTASGDHRN